MQRNESGWGVYLLGVSVSIVTAMYIKYTLDRLIAVFIASRLVLQRGVNCCSRNIASAAATSTHVVGIDSAVDLHGRAGTLLLAGWSRARSVVPAGTCCHCVVGDDTGPAQYGEQTPLYSSYMTSAVSRLLFGDSIGMIVYLKYSEISYENQIKENRLRSCELQVRKQLSITLITT